MAKTATIEAAQEAERLLDGPWARIAGGRLIPVDPAAIATEFGIAVFVTALEDNIAGALVKRPGKEATILLNSADPPNRQRFTCAHEIGHYLRRAETSGDVSAVDEFAYVDYRGPEASEGSNADERFANAFAASLLMPESELRAEHAKTPSVAVLADVFRVSLQAMNIRLDAMRLTRG